MAIHMSLSAGRKVAKLMINLFKINSNNKKAKAKGNFTQRSSTTNIYFYSRVKAFISFVLFDRSLIKFVIYYILG